MAEMLTSRLAGFHKLSMVARHERLAQMLDLTDEDLAQLQGISALQPGLANQMIENAVGTFSLPLGLGLNLQVNGQDFLVPMAVEEPSVVAAVSFASKIVREAGGFTADTDEPIMVGQVQLTRYGDATEATQKIYAAKEAILALANSFHPSMVKRGGGCRDIEVRLLPAPEGPSGEPLLVVHLIIDTQDAMGANLINTMAEGVAPLIEQLTGGKVFLRILSNLADRRLARASCRIPVAALADFEMPGEAIAEGIHQASRFAQADPYRAATHNKGIMNGIDSAAIAAGQDWRAIEAGAHAYACRDGQYRPLSTWTVEDGHLVGRIALPMALGTVGGPIKIHPGVRVNMKLLGVRSARELSMIFAAVGLAQNFAAVRALGSIGIQQGHMALHARCVAVTAGARGDWVEKIAEMLVSRGHVKVESAHEIIAYLPKEDFSAATGKEYKGRFMSMSKNLSGFGAGKVILLGEHSVTYGYPALAGPLTHGVTAQGEPASKCQLIVPEALKEDQREALKSAFARAAEACGEPGVKVSFNTDLPLSMGLGSSGALAVACARVLLQAAGQKTLPDDVTRVAREMEREFHGTGAGVDHTTSALEQLIIYSRASGTESGEGRVVASPKALRLVVVMAGNRSPTRQTLGRLGERHSRWPARYQRIFREMGLLASEGAEAVEKGDLDTLGDLMNVNHGLLAALGLSSPGIDDMVHRLRSMGALGAKLTGAGGDGGAVIGLFHDTEPVVHEFKRQGILCFDSQIAGPREDSVSSRGSAKGAA